MQNQILPATIEKIKLLFSKKTVYGSFREEIAMGECKTKAIQTKLGTFRHHRELFRHIQTYLEPCFTLTYLKLANPEL